MGFLDSLLGGTGLSCTAVKGAITDQQKSILAASSIKIGGVSIQSVIDTITNDTASCNIIVANQGKATELVNDIGNGNYSHLISLKDDPAIKDILGRLKVLYSSNADIGRFVDAVLKGDLNTILSLVNISPVTPPPVTPPVTPPPVTPPPATPPPATHPGSGSLFTITSSTTTSNTNTTNTNNTNNTNTSNMSNTNITANGNTVNRLIIFTSVIYLFIVLLCKWLEIVTPAFTWLSVTIVTAIDLLVLLFWPTYSGFRDLSSDQKYDVDLANRQIEINDWSYNNKMDTLFVFQVLFISILFACILVACKGAGLISSVFIWYSLAIVGVLDALMIINRSVYTGYRRDNRYWNRRKFDDDNHSTSPLRAGDTSYQTYLDTVKSVFDPVVPGGSGRGGGTGGGGTGGGACKC